MKYGDELRRELPAPAPQGGIAQSLVGCIIGGAHMTVRMKILSVALSLVAGGGAVLIFLYRPGDPLLARPRREWKTNAIAEVARLVKNTNAIATEIRTVQTHISQSQEGSIRWFSDKLILMKDGEWIAYASKCHKEDAGIRDIFIAQGSNGKWYYSTYHFCINMVSIYVDDQPDNLAKFIESYAVREFDGSSDDCLQRTWPAKRN